MNEAMKNLLTRRSVRAFKSDAVEQEKIEAIVEAGLYAATGAGIQDVSIVAISDEETKKELSAMNAKIMGKDIDPFYGAPVYIAVLGDQSMTDKYVYDGSCALMNMMNAAHALGLSSCWIHRAKEEFESEEGKALLAKWGVSGDLVGIGHLAVGYNAGADPEPKPRREGRAYYVR